MCSQCIDRRFGVLAAGLERFDPSTQYGIDIFYDPLPEGAPRTLASSFLQFARTASSTPGERLFYEFPELFQCIPSDAESVEVAEALTALLRRQGQTVNDVIADRIARAKAPLARGEVPATSLVRLAIGESAKALELPLEGNILRREGDTWLVVFEGKRTTVKALRGMAYLGYLIARQGQEVEARSMEAELFPNVRSASARRSPELARKAVSTAINGAVASIRTTQPDLAQHFDAALRLGLRPTYSPSTRIDWQL